MNLEDIPIKKRQLIVEITDILIANPGSKKQPLIRKFAKSKSLSERYCFDLFKMAGDYVHVLVSTGQAAKQRVYREALEVAREGVMSRDRALEILTNIAEGQVKKIPGEALEECEEGHIITGMDHRIRAINTLAEINGWHIKKEIVNPGSPAALQVNVLSEKAIKQLRKLGERKKPLIDEDGDESD